MKLISKIIVLLTLFVLLPKGVNAAFCENENMVKWQNIAKNVNVSYDAVEKNGKIDFTVTFSNMQKGLIILDNQTGKKYTYKKNEFSISGLQSKKSYRFDVYTDDFYCNGYILYSLYAVIPAYNSYYKDSLCNGIETYELCKKWVDVGYSYDEWKQKVREYRDSLIKKEELEKDNDKNKTLIEKIIDVYGEIYYIVLPVIIVLGGIIIYVYNKKRELF